jgi:hypothetical protein
VAVVDKESGRLTAITRETPGSTLAAASAIGAVTLTLRDVSDFDEGGGQAVIAQGTVSEEIVTYSGLDDAANTLALSAGTAQAHSLEDRIYVYPTSTTTWAYVQADDVDEPPLLCRVPLALAYLLVPGVRAPIDRLPVQVVKTFRGWEVSHIYGPRPSPQHRGARTYLAVGQVVGANAWISVLFDTIAFDTEEGVITRLMTPSESLVVPFNGYWEAQAAVSFTVGAGTVRQLRIQGGTPSTTKRQHSTPPIAGADTRLEIRMPPRYLLAGDILALQCWQDTAGNLTVRAGEESSYFDLIYRGQRQPGS